MASNWGRIKLAVTIVGLVLLCVIAYNVLLYLVRPHPPHVDYPVPSDLPPGSIVYEGGYVMIPGNASNYTAGPVDSGGADRSVGFLELPLWIQLYALPGMLLGLLTTLLAVAFVVRRVRNNENDNKQAVFTFITGNPGCTAPELARGRNMNIGTARYHIQRLQDEGRIVLEKIGKYSRIFVNSHTYDDREKRIASHLHNDTSRAIISTLMETPGISNQMLSEKLGMEKSLAFRYMQKLLEDGIVTFEWEGKNKLYYIDISAKETLIKLMPLHYQCPGLKKE
jgi:predicted transcriptional regulator